MGQVRPELQDIVDEVSRLLDAPTLLEDSTYNLIAFAAQRGDVDGVRQASILERRIPEQLVEWFEQFGIRQAVLPLRTPADESLEIMSRLCFPVRHHGVSQGFLWVLDDSRDVDDPAVVAVADLAAQAGQYLSNLSRKQEYDALAVGDLLSTDRESARQAAIRLVDRGTLSATAPTTVIVAGCWNPEPANRVIPQLTSLPRTMLADVGPSSATLILSLRRSGDSDSDTEDVARRVIELYRARVPLEWPGRIVAGIGSPCHNLADLRAHWLQARIAARVASYSENGQDLAQWSSLGIHRLLAAAPDAILADIVFDPAIEALLANPDQTLVTTARTYLDNAGHAQETAQALSIHRQTLYYRLDKVRQLTGLDLNRGADRTRLHVALTLAPVLKAHNTDG